MHSTDSFWDRIKRHKVVEWTLAYVAFGYALLHGVQMLRESFEWPLLVSRLTAISLVLGAPIAVTLAWFHGHRARHRVSGQELSILIALLLVAGSVLWFVSRHDRTAASSESRAPSPTARETGFNPPPYSIAVLPFVDMSEKHDQEYFGDGMAEEILDLLARIPGLRVIGRTSSFQFKGKNADLRTIGTELNTAHVLEGSVRNSGDRVRITAQLIDTRTGTHEWSDTYDRHIGDVLKLQDAVAAAVVRGLQLTVSPEFLPSRSTLRNTNAHDLILRGRHAADRYDKEGLDEAVTLFQQALDRDATSADAAAELAMTYYNQNAYLSLPGAAEQARRTAAVALKLDPTNELAHSALGAVHLEYDWDWAAAQREYHQAATIAPGSADVLANEAWLSLILGRWDEALRQMKAAIAQDPLDPNIFEGLTWVQMGRGHLAEAEVAMRRGLEIRPTYTWGHFILGLVLLARGHGDAALLEMQQETSDDARQGGLALTFYSLGKKTASEASLATMLKEQAAENAFLIANVYAFRVQSDEAMRWLERAYVQKDASLFLVKSYPPLKNLAADSRFKAFLRKMNLPE